MLRPVINIKVSDKRLFYFEYCDLNSMSNSMLRIERNATQKANHYRKFQIWLNF